MHSRSCRKLRSGSCCRTCQLELARKALQSVEAVRKECLYEKGLANDPVPSRAVLVNRKIASMCHGRFLATTLKLLVRRRCQKGTFSCPSWFLMHVSSAVCSTALVLMGCSCPPVTFLMVGVRSPPTRAQRCHTPLRGPVAHWPIMVWGHGSRQRAGLESHPGCRQGFTTKPCKWMRERAVKREGLLLLKGNRKIWVTGCSLFVLLALVIDLPWRRWTSSCATTSIRVSAVVTGH